MKMATFISGSGLALILVGIFGLFDACYGWSIDRLILGFCLGSVCLEWAGKLFKARDFPDKRPLSEREKTQ